MEIEEVIVRKEEHRSYPVWCERCRKVHYHPFPEAVAREGLFKERLTALVAYMKSVDHASFSTIRKFVRDVLGESVSRGYLRKVVAKASAALDAPYAELLGRLPLEQAINVDETGHKDNGGKFWTWVFRADLYMLFKIDKSRGSKVLLDVLGEEFDGVLGCDYFSSYHKYMKDFNVTVQFCIAHLIRDIKYLAGLKDAETKAYGQKLLAKVKAMFKIIHGRERLAPDTFDEAMAQAREAIIDAAINDVPSRLDADGKELKREAFNMAKRFRENGNGILPVIIVIGIGFRAVIELYKQSFFIETGFDIDITKRVHIRKAVAEIRVVYDHGKVLHVFLHALSVHIPVSSNNQLPVGRVIPPNGNGAAGV